MDGILPPENMVRCMANNYSTLGFWRSWHRSYNLWIIRWVLAKTSLPRNQTSHSWRRYIYIPLGGAKNTVVNTLLVFTFVALWHDLSFRLLAWGWLVSLFVIPELLANYLLPKSKVRTYQILFCSQLCSHRLYPGPFPWNASPFVIRSIVWKPDSELPVTGAKNQFGKRAWFRHVCAIGAVGNVLMMMAANLVGFVIGTDGIRFFVSQLVGTAEGKSTSITAARGG